MNPYLFEMYTNDERGRRFLGYKKVYSESTESALLCAQEESGNTVQLCQLYFNEQDKQAR